MGFDVVQHDYLRSVLRGAVGALRRGQRQRVDVGDISGALPARFRPRWRAVTCFENHDLVLAGRDRGCRRGRPVQSPSWYARSRSRVATAILLTAPGIPQIFMGQEFFEDRPWTSIRAGRTFVMGRLERHRIPPCAITCVSRET
jgi:1,4-alpha-glucan branching enzyme